ncbi:hypothetical protein [Stenotrophomonas sp. SMYL86]|uniref:hypothetical protein n=1 Tax=Stenotrophomonas sp. SMYL86 TaxID=3076044 RepID=UPI002E79D5F0|nr:hypothetical protein [Stenotrophomonas sp. SMYL86]
MADNETRVYRFKDRSTGKEASVAVTVNWDELAMELGFRALRAKGDKAVSLNGAVEAKVARNG